LSEDAIMEMPRNAFKAALKAGKAQIGLWVTLADAYAAEGLASAGFDWLLIDGEHAPNDVRSMLGQLQAMAPYPVHPIVRPVIGDVHLIKQILEIGTQTLLIPVVETAEQAALMVAATRYPPKGIRGVGNAVARSSRWNQIKDYSHKADDEMCVLVQVETRAGLENLDAIAAVPGVDGVFGPPGPAGASRGAQGHARRRRARPAGRQGAGHSVHRPGAGARIPRRRRAVRGRRRGLFHAGPHRQPAGAVVQGRAGRRGQGAGSRGLLTGAGKPRAGRCRKARRNVFRSVTNIFQVLIQIVI
jgi:4-hydroxy-2-oxoheptanedioate aldolase